MTNKTVHIQYFALLQDERGQTGETLETSAATVGELYQELKIKYSFSLSTDVLRAAVNDEYKPWDTEIQNNDKIVFIPPVAGG
jgi:molybdopterin converting factor subunit 1